MRFGVFSLVVFIGLAALSWETVVHIESGCITINHDYTCACSGLFCHLKDYSGPDPITTVIFILDERDPPCEMNFHWPTDFAEVYYGNDRCLRDARHLPIDNQCCPKAAAPSEQSNAAIDGAFYDEFLNRFLSVDDGGSNDFAEDDSNMGNSGDEGVFVR